MNFSVLYVASVIEHALHDIRVSVGEIGRAVERQFADLTSATSTALEKQSAETIAQLQHDLSQTLSHAVESANGKASATAAAAAAACTASVPPGPALTVLQEVAEGEMQRHISSDRERTLPGSVAAGPDLVLSRADPRPDPAEVQRAADAAATWPGAAAASALAAASGQNSGQHPDADMIRDSGSGPALLSVLGQAPDPRPVRILGPSPASAAAGMRSVDHDGLQAGPGALFLREAASRSISTMSARAGRGTGDDIDYSDGATAAHAADHDHDQAIGSGATAAMPYAFAGDDHGFFHEQAPACAASSAAAEFGLAPAPGLAGLAGPQLQPSSDLMSVIDEAGQQAVRAKMLQQALKRKRAAAAVASAGLGSGAGPGAGAGAAAGAKASALQHEGVQLGLLGLGFSDGPGPGPGGARGHSGGHAQDHAHVFGRGSGAAANSGPRSRSGSGAAAAGHGGPRTARSAGSRGGRG